MRAYRIVRSANLQDLEDRVEEFIVEGVPSNRRSVSCIKLVCAGCLPRRNS